MSNGLLSHLIYLNRPIRGKLIYMKKLNVLATLLVASALILAGCKSSQPAAAPTPAPGQSAAQPDAQPNNGTLNSDGTVNPPAQAAPQQPAAQAPATSQNQAAPAPGSAMMMQGPPAPPAPVAVTAPIGTRVLIRTTESLSASHNEVGDPFTGVIDTAVVSHGSTIFAPGTRVTGTVIAAKGRGRFKGAGALGIELNTIAGLRVQTNEYEREVSGKGKRTGGLIGGGAGLGAIIGGIAGGGKGALIGGLAGAGAGTAGAAYTGNKDVVLPSESLVTFHLTAPVSVKK